MDHRLWFPFQASPAGEAAAKPFNRALNLLVAGLDGSAAGLCGPPLPSTGHRAQDHPGPEAENDQVDDHLPGDHQPGHRGGGGDIAEPDGGEHGDGEVQRVGAGQRDAEAVGTSLAKTK